MIPDSTGNVLDVRGAVRQYGAARGLDGLSLSMPSGVIFGLLGPNGSGKSTLLTLLAAGEQPSAGEIRFRGELLTPDHRRELGVVFQEPTLDPLARVCDNLELSGRLYGMGKAMIRTRSEELLAAFGLSGRWLSPIASLSGGMRRRVEIVRAILHRPTLLVLDEPTTGVDPGERQAIWKELRELAANGCTVMLATNDLAEADEVCGHACFIDEGRAVAIGPISELKSGLERESVLLSVEGDAGAALDAIAGITGRSAVSSRGSMLQISTANASELVPKLFQVDELSIRTIEIRRATLQDAYFKLVSSEASSSEVAA